VYEKFEWIPHPIQFNARTIVERITSGLIFYNAIFMYFGISMFNKY